MLSPRDGQALGEGLKENRSLKELCLNNNSIGDSGAKAPRWGGSPKGLDGEVCEEKRKPVGDVVGPCVLVPSWWDMWDYLNVIETIWTLSQLETFTLDGLVTSDACSFCTSCTT